MGKWQTKDTGNESKSTVVSMEDGDFFSTEKSWVNSKLEEKSIIMQIKEKNSNAVA